MKSRIQYLSYCLLFICIINNSCSCENDTQLEIDEFNSSNLFKFNLSENWGENESEFTSLFNGLDVIPLTLPDSLYLVSIDKIEISNNRIFVLDKKFSNLFCFTVSGEFIGQIGKIGSGPGEFLGIEDFNLYENNIILMSTGNLSTFIYDQSDFSFKKQVKLGLFGYSFVPLTTEKNLVYINHNPSLIGGNNNLFLTSKNSRNPTKYFPFDPKKSNMIIDFSGFLTVQNERVFFKKPFDKYVYELDLKKEEFYTVYEFETVSDYILENKYNFSKIFQPEVLTNPEKKTSFIGSTFLISDDHVVFDYHFKSKIFYGIYDFNKNVFKTFSKSAADPMFKILGKPIYLNRNKIYFSFSSESYIDFKNKYGNNEFLEQKIKVDINNSANNYYLVSTHLK